MPTALAQAGSDRGSSRPWLVGVAVLTFTVLTAALCFAFPNDTPQFDEFYHLLAARSLLHEGDLTITENARPYTRGVLFTYAVAGSQRLFGETLIAARVPSAVSTGLLAGFAFWWLRPRVGWVAGLVAVLLTALSLHVLHYGATVRFYSPHALAVFVGAVAAFEVVEAWRSAGWRPVSRWLGWLALGAAAWLLALHLQATTLIAGLAVGIWCAGVGVAWWWRQPSSMRGRWALLAGGVAAGGALAFWWTGGYATVLEVYRRPRAWSEGTAHDVGFYHRLMSAWYAPLWWALPLWVALGWKRSSRVVVFLLVFLLVVFGVHSVASVKADRYVLYALPFLFILAAVGVGGMVGLLWHWAGLDSKHGETPRAGRVVAVVSLAGMLSLVGLYALYRTPGVQRTARLVAGQPVSNPFQRSDWLAAQPMLSRLNDKAEVSVTSATLKSLYYLDWADVVLSEQGLRAHETLRRPPTVIVAGTISSAADLAAVRDAHATGVVVIEDEHWRQPVFVPPATADWIEQELTPVPTEEAWRLRVYAWGLDPTADITDLDRAVRADRDTEPDPNAQGP